MVGSYTYIHMGVIILILPVYMEYNTLENVWRAGSSDESSERNYLGLVQTKDKNPNSGL